jgi:hypothetical protein
MVTRRGFFRLAAVAGAGTVGIAGTKLAHAVINEQTYSPDTCACVVVEQWDSEVPPAQRIISLARIVTRGPEHSTLFDASLYSVIREENHRKNRAVNISVEEGSTKTLQFGEVRWAFTPGRTLEVSFPPERLISQAIKNKIQARCDVDLGIGSVVVV